MHREQVVGLMVTSRCDPSHAVVLTRGVTHPLSLLGFALKVGFWKDEFHL